MVSCFKLNLGKKNLPYFERRVLGSLSEGISRPILVPLLSVRDVR